MRGSFNGEMAPSALALLLVRFYLVFKCVTAVPIDSIDFDKGEKIKF